MNVSKLEKHSDVDSGDSNVSKTLNEKPPDNYLHEEKPGLQKEKPGLQKVADAQQVRPLCPSPRWVHG